MKTDNQQFEPFRAIVNLESHARWLGVYAGYLGNSPYALVKSEEGDFYNVVFENGFHATLPKRFVSQIGSAAPAAEFKQFRCIVDLSRFRSWWESHHSTMFVFNESAGVVQGEAVQKVGEPEMWYVLFDDETRTRVPKSFVTHEDDYEPDMISYPFPVTVDLAGWLEWDAQHRGSLRQAGIFDTPVGFATKYTKTRHAEGFVILFENLSSAFVPKEFVTVDSRDLSPVDVQSIASKLEGMVKYHYSKDDAGALDLIYGIYETLYILNNAPLPQPPAPIILTKDDVQKISELMEHTEAVSKLLVESGFKMRGKEHTVRIKHERTTVGDMPADYFNAFRPPDSENEPRARRLSDKTPMRTGKWFVRQAGGGYSEGKDGWLYSIYDDSTDLDPLVASDLDHEDAVYIADLHNRRYGFS